MIDNIFFLSGKRSLIQQVFYGKYG